MAGNDAKEGMMVALLNVGRFDFGGQIRLSDLGLGHCDSKLILTQASLEDAL